MKKRSHRNFSLVCAAIHVMAAVTATPTQAQEPASDVQLALELNSAADVEGACRLTFVVENSLAADVSSLVLEAVIFDANGGVNRLTLFDFQSVPSGRPRVRQFDLAGSACGSVASVLVNGINTCDGEGLDPNFCQDALSVGSRLDIKVQG